MLEVIGFPTHIRRLFQEYLPFELRNDSWPFLYKALEPGVHEALSSADLWHASLFDGDGGL